MAVQEEEVLKSCGNNQVNHLQREHGELGTWSCKPPKPSIRKSRCWEGHPWPISFKISASGKLALVTHPPWLLERERLDRNQAEKPEISTSYVWNVTLKMLLRNKVVAIKPWLGHLLVGTPSLQKGSPGTPSRLDNHQPSPISIRPV